MIVLILNPLLKLKCCSSVMNWDDPPFGSRSPALIGSLPYQKRNELSQQIL